MKDADPRLEVLERLLAITTADLRQALSQAGDVVASALRAEKVDAFLYDPERESLVAVGTSNQPLSALERRIGLDVMPLANGGSIVSVFRTGEPFLSGRLDDDAEELRGIRDGLGVRSTMSVAFEVGGARRGVLTLAARTPDLWSAEDLHFAEALGRWVAMLVERAELVGEIERAARERGRRSAAEELITTVAHDLRSFVSPVDLRLHLVHSRAEAAGRADDARDVEMARRSLARITTLISDVLDVERVDRRLLAMEMQAVDVSPLVRDLAATLATPDRAVNVGVGEELLVMADAARLRQCLQNIIANALRYSPSGAAVEVRVPRATRGARPFARIDVIDEGPGVAADVLPHVFDRFVTAGPKRSGGLGLGLFLAKQIASLQRRDADDLERRARDLEPGLLEGIEDCRACRILRKC